MNRRRSLACAVSLGVLSVFSARAEKMQIGFLWHMHQPIYYPGESIIQTDNNNRYSYSVKDIHNQRFGPYTTWPRDAIQSGLGLPNLGASVSFSGTLMKNLNDMQAAGVNGGMWNNWQGAYSQARGWNTAEGNPRLDMIGFNWAHALMPLLDTRDMRMQIQLHKQAVANTFGSSVPYSKGFFPAETAFSERMIPALKAEGIDWTLVDNIHFDRATKNYPHTNSSGLFAPNKADQINPDPATTGGAWVQLNNVWAPSKVSAPFSYRPHNVQYVDPSTGVTTKMVAVPAARYEGNEDGRGGFGALQYESVLDQVRSYNTDPAHPMLAVLHHDGDNYGGGSDSYYHTNFQNMVNWATSGSGASKYNVTTISDHLKRFPVAANDVIHVENGSWAGADNGDAEFKKWLGDPNGSGWSPDRNSWAVLTAAKNRVFTAEDILPITNHNNILNNAGNNTDKAWHYLVQAEASDHWYWDGTEIWDSNVTRGSNLAVQKADQVIASYFGVEQTPPTVFVPQRDSYNPGEKEFNNTAEPSDFKVWTYAYDVSGLQSVTLKYRLDNDGENPLSSSENETYAGGGEVGAWASIPMTSGDVAPPGSILAPQYRALQYAGQIAGVSSKLVDYYVEAVDHNGNVTKSDIQHVWVGNSTGGGGSGTTGPKTAFTMDGVLDAEAKEAASNGGMKLHVAMRGGKLYVATNDAGETNDHFIYLALAPGAMRAANWAKAGQIAGWDAYLADENDNDYEGWFDTTGATAAATGPNGGVLEGTLDLAGEFGSIPAELWMAVGLFTSPDGGTLLPAYGIPISADGNGNLNANEYIKIALPQGWQQLGTGSWSVAFNWAEGTPNAVGAHAKFLNISTTSTNVNVDTNVTVGQMTFDSPATYTVSGAGSINLDVASGVAAISVHQGAHLIAAAMTMSDSTNVNVATGASLGIGTTLTLANGSTFAKLGGGSVEINAPVVSSTNAHFQVNAGLLKTNVDLNSALDVNGGSATLESNQHLTSLSIASGGTVTLSDALTTRVLKTGPISISGQLEIADNTVIVDHSGASPIASIRSALAAGSLTSSATIGRPDRAIGYAEAASIGSPSTFFGESIDNTSLLLCYTLAGDSNLDGKVNTVDFNNLAGAFGASNSFWIDGDFSYDGQVSSIDFNTLAQNYGSYMTLSAPLPNLGTIVPEPASVSMLLGSALLLRRRPR